MEASRGGAGGHLRCVEAPVSERTNAASGIAGDCDETCNDGVEKGEQSDKLQYCSRLWFDTAPTASGRELKKNHPEMGLSPSLAPFAKGAWRAARAGWTAGFLQATTPPKKPQPELFALHSPLLRESWLVFFFLRLLMCLNSAEVETANGRHSRRKVRI